LIHRVTPNTSLAPSVADHGGGDIGYRTRIFAVERGEGGFGVVVLINTQNFQGGQPVAV
jgi:hypothetical protein